MSKLIDKLKRSSWALPEPMGFKTQKQTSPKLEMLLIASLPQNDIERLVPQIAGADAVAMSIPKSDAAAKALEKIPQAVSDLPCGGWLQGGLQVATSEVPKSGGDFVIFPTNTALDLFHGGEVGTILEVELSLSEGLIRAINDLPVDAVLVAIKPEESRALTWHHLMLLQRFRLLLTKPLLASVPPNVTVSELQSLWEAGVKGIVVAVDSGQPANRIPELRQMIAKLTPPSPRKGKKAEVLVPYIGGETTATEEESEEEEEE